MNALTIALRRHHSTACLWTRSPLSISTTLCAHRRIRASGHRIGLISAFSNSSRAMAGGLPPFEPSATDLEAQASSLNAAISEYSSAKDAKSKVSALAKVSATVEGLSKATTDPGTIMERFVFSPQANAIVRVAIGMGLFDAIPVGQTATSTELAKKCCSETDFVQRVARAVASQGFLVEHAEETYGHTATSYMFCRDTAKAALAHMFDNVAVTMFRLNDYFRKFGYKSPTDIENTPTVFARGLENIGYFDWLAQNPELHAIFNKTMTFHATTWAGGIAASYPWDKLQPGGPDGIAVIDIGGGKGQAIREIITAFPSLSGHAGLEDLGSVLAEEGSLVTPEQVKSVAYDFIKQEQPIIGAGAYYFRHCLCDWPDWTVVTILKNQVAAMKANPASKLLITDMVLPDFGANAHRTARDIIMLQCGGVERSEKQWHRILGEAGFRIEKFHNSDDLHNGVIEAVLK